MAGSTYTEKAKFMLGEFGPEDLPDGITEAQLSQRNARQVDIMGGGTWKYTEDRAEWAVWSTPVLTTTTLLLTKPPIYQKKIPSSTMLTDPFTNDVWEKLFIAASVASVVFWFTAVVHERTKNEIPVWKVAYNTFAQCFDFNVR